MSGSGWILLIIGAVYVAIHWEEWFGTEEKADQEPERPRPAPPPPVAPSRPSPPVVPDPAPGPSWPPRPTSRPANPIFPEPHLSGGQVRIWNKCHHRWYLEYDQGIAPAFDNEMGFRFGRVVHETLEAVYRWAQAESYSGSLVDTAVLDVAVDAFDRSLRSNRLYENMEAAARDRWVSHLSGSSLLADDQILHVEEPITVTIDSAVEGAGGVLLAGIPDLVLQRGDDYVEIVDFKTSKRRLTESDLAADRAQAIYAMWVQEQYPDTPVISTYERLKFTDRVHHQFVEIELAAVTDEFRMIDQQIALAKHHAHWPATLDVDCFGCPLRRACKPFAEWSRKP